MATTAPVTADTLVAIKINVDGFNRRFKLPLKDLGPLTLHQKVCSLSSATAAEITKLQPCVTITRSRRHFKHIYIFSVSSLPEQANIFVLQLRSLLSIPDDTEVIFERYSDSAADFVTLDPNNAQVFKQLNRAAKAKLKLRLKLTVIGTETKAPVKPKPATVEDEVPSIEDTKASTPETTPQKVEKAASPVPVPAPVPAMAANYYNPYGASCYRTPGPVQPQPIPVYAPPVDFPRTNFTLNQKPTHLSDLKDKAHANARAAVAEASAAAAAIPAVSAPTPVQAAPKCPMSIPAVCSSNPVTFGSVAREKWYAELAALTMDRQNALRTNRLSPVSTRQPMQHDYSVYCNSCKAPIPDEHYHCSTCDEGDYDLCPKCVDSGILCGGDDHWMIKRNVKNGRVVSSTTEKLPPRQIPTNDSKATLVPEKDEPLIQVKEDVKPAEEWVRTCNCCLIETKEDSFITCKDCPDYDLCIECHIDNKHGHHPKHTFVPATDVLSVRMGWQSKQMLEAGRNIRHQAICDGCDKNIYGIRHKCLDCPDWDYCNTCVKSANYIHKGHRFVPIYDAISYPVMTREETHIGIYCDGPLCKNKRSYIQGHRFKCAVCHDTDFCASCEASPSNLHNKTHPVIKIKTPIRSMSITTTGDHENGRPLPVMGDRIRRCRSAATATTPSSNAATQVQTVAETKPKPAKKEVVQRDDEAEVKDWVHGVLGAQKVAVKEEPKELEVPKSVEAPTPVELKKEVEAAQELIANFVRDTIPDSTILPPGVVFEQTWYLRNDGKTNWPAGCSVKFIGGDNMCATDPEHPASVHELVSAAESTTCYTEVAPGQEHGFTVLMRTPLKQGKVVSYWRLTGPSGEKFGHRLWCDVEVKGKTVEVKEEKIETPAPAPVEAPVEAPTAEVKAEKVDNSTASSQLSFPKLAKESPEQSVHEAEAPVPEPFEAADDDFVDFTSVANDAESASDDFLTDEEYDILDASDEEEFAGARK